MAVDEERSWGGGLRGVAAWDSRVSKSKQIRAAVTFDVNSRHCSTAIRCSASALRLATTLLVVAMMLLSVPTNAFGQSRRPGLQSVLTASHIRSDTPIADLSISDHSMHGHTVGASSACDSCGPSRQCNCNSSFLLDWSRMDLWMGVVSFNGQGNFVGGAGLPDGEVGGLNGFQQGFNFGSQMPSILGGQIGSQIGMRFTQTAIDGSTAGDDARNQMFLTAGLFRRVDYGVQGGLVVDYLHDDWVYQASLLQLRGEVSYLFSKYHDLGFRFTDSQQTDSSVLSLPGGTSNIELEALATYRFFYRFQLGDQGRSKIEVNGGFTEDNASIWGLDMLAPLSNELGLDASVMYSPAASDAMRPHTMEAWNASIALVWTPGRRVGGDRDYYRPLMKVADAGTMLIRRIMP